MAEGETGFLVDYPDSAALAAQVTRLLEDPALRERVGSAGRERVVAHYSAAGMVRQIEDLYATLLSAKTH
jgi:glycosyltransferase involved in cell wall biosynthesis